MNNRIYYLDVAKVIGTFLVVFAHLYSYGSPVRIPIYSFHMPFFFVVSGIFHKYKGDIQISKYFKSLLVPTAIFIVLALLYEPFMAFLFEGGSLLEQVIVFLKSTTIGIIKGGNIGIYWFLIVLFCCKIMTDFYCKSEHKKVILLLWLILLSVSCFTKFPLYISQTVMAMPFYLIGYHYRESFKGMSLERYGGG